MTRIVDQSLACWVLETISCLELTDVEVERCLASAASARPATAEVSDLFAVVPAIMEQSFWPLCRINVGHNSRPVLPLNREIGRKDFCPHHSTWQERGMNSVGIEIPCGKPSEHPISLSSIIHQALLRP